MTQPTVERAAYQSAKRVVRLFKEHDWKWYTPNGDMVPGTLDLVRKYLDLHARLEQDGGTSITSGRLTVTMIEDDEVQFGLSLAVAWPDLGMTSMDDGRGTQ